MTPELGSPTEHTQKPKPEVQQLRPSRKRTRLVTLTIPIFWALAAILLAALMVSGTQAALLAQSSTDIRSRAVTPDGTMADTSALTLGGRDEQQPSIFIDQHGLLAVWEQNTGSHLDLYYADQLGVSTSPSPLVTAEGDQRGAAVAGDGTGSYLVVWQDTRGGDADIYARLHPSGVATDLVIAQAANDQTNPSVAYNPDDDVYLVVWQDRRDYPNEPDIWGQQVSGDGVLVGSAFTITASLDRQRSPHVAYAPGRGVYLVVWRHYTGAPTSGLYDYYFDVYGQLVSRAGASVGSPFPIAARTEWADRESPSDIAYNSKVKQFMVVYQDLHTGYWNVWGRPVSVTGTLSSKVQISFNDFQHEAESVIAYNPDDDAYLVVYSYRATPGSTRDIRARRILGSGTLEPDTLFLATGASNQTEPDVAYMPQTGTYVVVWREDVTVKEVYLPLVIRN